MAGLNQDGAFTVEWVSHIQPYVQWGPCFVAQANLQLIILLPQSLDCWDYSNQCAPSHLDHFETILTEFPLPCVWFYFLESKVWEGGGGGKDLLYFRWELF